MQKGFRIFSIILAILLAIYFSWSKTGRQAPRKNIRPLIDTSYTVNYDSGLGNLVGINPYMTAADYASRGHFFDKLDAYLLAADQKGWLNEKTTVLFPEYIGTWLVVANEKTSLYSAPTATRALSTFVGSNFFSYLRAWFTAPDEATDKVKHGIFASKGQSMANIYQETFSELARKYKVSIIAGSILLPNPETRKNRIEVRKGVLQNITAVFNPDGSLQPRLVRKSFPTAEEQPFVAASPVSDLPTFDLPTGKTTVLICADAWFPEPYKAASKASPLILAVPSFTPRHGSMSEPWQGYSGFSPPADADTSDIGRISLRDAWVRYTMPGRIRSSGAAYGLHVALRGSIWDLGSDGEIMAYNRGIVVTPPPVKQASLICLWIN